MEATGSAEPRNAISAGDSRGFQHPQPPPSNQLYVYNIYQASGHSFDFIFKVH